MKETYKGIFLVKSDICSVRCDNCNKPRVVYLVEKPKDTNEREEMIDKKTSNVNESHTSADTPLSHPSLLHYTTSASSGRKTAAGQTSKLIIIINSSRNTSFLLFALNAVNPTISKMNNQDSKDGRLDLSAQAARHSLISIQRKAA